MGTNGAHNWEHRGPLCFPPVPRSVTKPTNAPQAPQAPQAPSLAAELAAAMLDALRAAAPQAPTRTPKADRDPWESVQLTPAQTDALTKLGWLQSGWRPLSAADQKTGPEYKFRAGPQQPQLSTFTDKIKCDPEGLINYQVRGMICARLSQYGRVHIGDCAVVCNAMGCKSFASTSELCASIKQTLGKRAVVKTVDGFIQCDLKERQTLHDVFIMMFDKVMKARTA